MSVFSLCSLDDAAGMLAEHSVLLVLYPRPVWLYCLEHEGNLYLRTMTVLWYTLTRRRAIQASGSSADGLGGVSRVV